MFKTIFWMAVMAVLYFWAVTSEEDNKVLTTVQSFSKALYQKVQDMDLKWHVHTPACSKKR